MMELVQPVLFYLFSAVLLASAVMVVAARNPVHAVLFLILCFFNAAGLFLLIGAEFVAFILVIVYVGAVAVLFLFVVMMLDINFKDMRQGAKNYLLTGLTVGGILAAELAFIGLSWHMGPKVADAAVTADAVENTRAIGQLLYTDYFYPFQVSGLVLLIAMIGAIVLTHRIRPDARRQNATRQLDRQIKDVIDIRKVQPGQGIDI
jgi:NADH-quinone oxidoreductase subunit J